MQAVETLKRCSHCRRMLPKSLFWRRRNTPDGLEYSCMECRKGFESKRAYNERRKCKPQRKWNEYKRGADKRNIKWDLTWEQFMHFWQKPCMWCGAPIPHIGLDRLNSSGSYEFSNIVSSCHACNKMKGTMTVEEFAERIVNIAQRLKDSDILRGLTTEILPVAAHVQDERRKT